jgi:hypothetical protein
MPACTNRNRRPSESHHERCVPGIDQFAGSADDVLQRRIQIIGVGHGQIRPQQPAQPSLGS